MEELGGEEELEEVSRVEVRADLWEVFKYSFGGRLEQHARRRGDREGGS